MSVQSQRAFDLLGKIGFVRTSGSEEEKRASEILVEEIRAMGLEPEVETFMVEDANEPRAVLKVLEPYEKEYTVTGYKCGLNTPKEGLTAELLYVESALEANLADAKGKIVLVNGVVNRKNYKKLTKAGVAGFISMGGTLRDRIEETDLDTKKVRKGMEKYGMLSGVHVRMADAFEMIVQGARKVNLVLEGEREMKTSRNICLTIPGSRYPEEIISFGAHYDSVPFSTGVYDNGAGSVILMELAHAFAEKAPLRTVKLNWFGSEEVGLEGSKAYVAAHKEELKKHKLMINVDVAGPVIGIERTMVTAQESVKHFVDYWMKIKGYPVEVKQDIYSSDSIPFADNGVPAINFCRFGIPGSAFIHGRYDIMKYLSADALNKTLTYVAEFSREMTDAIVCPIEGGMPDNMVKKVDEYLDKTVEEQK
ncbi:MAG: M28 family peptidase [bacterium]|nr:M28 family peptidase [bacterium]